MACSYEKLDPISQTWQTVTPPTCMKCKYLNPTTGLMANKDVTWRPFPPNCPKINFVCNPQAYAYVAAVTVCNMHLW